ncbi:ELAV-like protein 3 [Dreissena polymorpha]|nr:ELAV-like protein 3 [Dreissena polymorpha]XP_052222839.1 ELAV-like protein 3 [Dreissena polymorpha]XP_052222840.1 ELAV-like protein 3 [Dreissena polymorpha]XP_052222841.1 ELAV-like protein 3 [Dreissena polymorpha]XP_052222842.1 ELAV-like protein 3 [Dreissena polymorpha]KAH3794016.1 hypothetical protein DPMN_147545 [Dreissena polymorpha]KAH3794050.1 hypothetical protein DPMN_147579 [Dreissena polymorpha]
MSYDDNPNKTNLIINYLPQVYTDDEMYTLFATIGNVVNCRIIRDKNTGYSYGFGFVEYSSPEEAQNAIMSLNGCEIQNKRIKVALARPPGENTKGANLYVRNVPQHYSEDDLRDIFAQYGTIVQVRILIDHNTNMSKGVGFVLFESRSMAENAMAWNNKVPPNGTLPLSIKFADENSKKVRPPPGEMGGYGYGMQSRGGFSGGPMRGPAGGSRMRYNPMGTGAGMGNGYGSYSGGYQGGYVSPAGAAPKRGMGVRMGTPGRGAARNSGSPYGAGATQFGAGDASDTDGTILFVYNIGVDATEGDLWNLFTPYGMVKKVNIIWDHAKNQCKGFGFVTMSTLDEAKYAIEYLNGFYYKTAPLQVSIKTDKK